MDERSSEDSSETASLIESESADRDDHEIRRVSRKVTVEPVIIIYFTVFMANDPLTQQYIYGQIGQKYNITNGGIVDERKCGFNMSQHEKDAMDKVQSEAAGWIMANTIIPIVPLLFSTWFLGSYSDKAGRKIGIILPLCGVLIYLFGCVIVTAFHLPFWYIYIGSFISGVSGGPSTILTACYSYIADVTEAEERSKRMVIISLCEGIGTVGVQIGIGYAIRHIGFVWSFAILGGMITVCAVYAIFFLEETITKKNNTKIISKEHFLKPVRLFYRDNGTNRLWQIRIVTIIIMLQVMTELGVSTVLTLYLYARPLCFGPIDLGIFNGTQCLIGVIGSIFIVWCCLKKLTDTGLMILGCLSLLAYLVIMAFSFETYVVFIALILGSADGLVIPLARSILSKSVQSGEQGSLFAAISWVMLIGAFIGSSAFIPIYAATVAFMPGFTFLIGAGFSVITTALCIWVLKYGKSSNNTDVSVEEQQVQVST